MSADWQRSAGAVRQPSGYLVFAPPRNAANTMLGFGKYRAGRCGRGPSARLNALLGGDSLGADFVLDCTGRDTRGWRMRMGPLTVACHPSKAAALSISAAFSRLCHPPTEGRPVVAVESRTHEKQVSCCPSSLCSPLFSLSRCGPRYAGLEIETLIHRRMLAASNSLKRCTLAGERARNMLQANAYHAP